MSETKKDWTQEFVVEWADDKWSCDGQWYTILGSEELNRTNTLIKADGRKRFWNPFYVKGTFDHETDDMKPKALAYRMEQMKTSLQKETDPTVIERIKHNMSVVNELIKEVEEKNKLRKMPKRPMPSDKVPDEDEVEIVMKQTSCSRERAIDMLRKHSNLVDAILDIEGVFD